MSWDAAVACIKSAVESGLDVITNPLPMLYIKDFLLLCCSTLGVHPQPQTVMHIISTSDCMRPRFGQGCLTSLQDMSCRIRHFARFVQMWHATSTSGLTQV